MTHSKGFESVVVPLEETPISHIRDHTGERAGYGDNADIRRYFAGEPLYTAVHVVDGAPQEERKYGIAHTHPFPEVNVLAGAPGELVYRIRVGEEEREVESPAVIVIPPDVIHSANLVKGSGAFVVLRLTPEQLEDLM
ncbi:MAG TPA: hypothetical protein VIF43_04310 [Patescibacteria group bacterium]|jgi:quercetin dioxygenase-like cupin family protein